MQTFGLLNKLKKVVKANINIMEKKYTEQDLRNAFKGGKSYGYDDMDALNENEWIEKYTEEEIIEEETVPITLGFIKLKCGWLNYCDVVTSANPYMLNEWDVSNNAIFDVKISDAKKLGLIY